MIYGAEFVSKWIIEMKEMFLGQRLFRVEGGDTWLALRFSSQTLSLLISWHPQHFGCCLIDEEDLDLMKRFSSGKLRFADALKSHLVKGELTAVEQIDFDRLLILKFSRKVGAGFDVENSLVFECMERNSNLILLDENNTIIDCVKHIHPEINRYRTVVPSHPYITPPPLQGPSPFDIQPEDFAYEDIAMMKGIGKGLRQFIKAHQSLFTSGEWIANIAKLYNEETLKNNLIQTWKNYVTIFPLLLEDMIPVSENKALIVSKDFVVDPLLWDKSNRLKKDTLKVIKKEIKSLERHRKGIEKQRSESEKAPWYKNCGELLLANLYKIPPRTENISLTGWTEDGEITLQIPLDPKKNASDNAAVYFKKYKKAKGDLEKIEREISELTDKISELQDQIDIIEELEVPSMIDSVCRDIKEWLVPNKNKKRKRSKKESSTPPHLRLSYEEALILVGLNARGNRHVTFQEATAGDIWLHVHEIPGSHVIIKHPEARKENLEGTDLLVLAASLAAFFSKARHSTKVQVDYTERKHVRHIPGSGIAHVTYTHPETILIEPDRWKEYFSEKEIALGEVRP